MSESNTHIKRRHFVKPNVCMRSSLDTDKKHLKWSAALQKLLVQRSSSVSILQKSSYSCNAAAVSANGNTFTGPFLLSNYLFIHSSCVYVRFRDAHLTITSSSVNCLLYRFVSCDHLCWWLNHNDCIFHP